MNVFSQTSVTVIRKRNGMYIEEEITTVPVLPASKLSAEQNRKNTIARLRKDPAVVFVLETHDGVCEERTILPDGFEMTISIRQEGQPIASFVVLYEGNIVNTREFNAEGDDEYDKTLRVFLGNVKCILSAIDRKDYYFVDDDCPYFEEREQEPSLSLYDIKRIMQQEGFQCEEIQIVGSAINPFMFVHENDIALVGSYHFDGDYIFVEMKRIFDNVKATDVENAIEKAKSDTAVTAIPWYDGSWSFRLSLDNDQNEEEFLGELLSAVDELKVFIRKVEAADVIYESGSFETDLIRSLFIYENVDASLKLSRLPI